MTGLRELVNSCTKVYSGTVCAFLKKENGYGYIFSVCKENEKEASLSGLARDFNEKCSGRGGGSNVMVTGTTGASRKDIEEYFASIVP